VRILLTIFPLLEGDKLKTEGEKHEWLKSFFQLLLASIIGCSIFWLGNAYISSRISKRQDNGAGGYARQYSEQDGRATEALGRIGESIGELKVRLPELRAGYDIDATDIRGIATAFRVSGEKVKGIEELVDDLWDWYRSFVDDYYNSLDNEIERELGIRVPK